MSKGTFSLRRDQNGLRPVYNLGNELGDCPHHCKFCSVGRSPQVTSDQNIREFDAQHAAFLGLLDDTYHPLIYNQGNVTNPAEFSEAALRHVLTVFKTDPRVAFVSLNSREKYITPERLEKLLSLDLPFPLHFIFGVESFSPKAPRILGKDTRGELERLLATLRPFNRRTGPGGRRSYDFGLDVNLVFLPEIYLGDGQSRAGNESLVSAGMLEEIRHLLSLLNPDVPVEINLHPYHRVDRLPYEDMDLSFFMNTLPEIQRAVERYNGDNSHRPTHLFLGIEGSGFDSAFQMEQADRWRHFVDQFNRTGRCEWVQATTTHE